MYIYKYVDVEPLVKTAGVVVNSGHCIYSIGLTCFLNYLSLFHLVFYLLQSNTRYFVDQLERYAYHYIYENIYIYIHLYTWCRNNIVMLAPRVGSMNDIRVDKIEYFKPNFFNI